MRSLNAAIVLLACTLVILQETNAKTVYPLRKQTPKNIEEDVQSVILHQRNAMKEVKADGEKIAEANDIFEETWDKELTLKRSKFDEIEAEAIQNVKDAEKLAKEQGVNVDDCVRIYYFIMGKDEGEIVKIVGDSWSEFHGKHYWENSRIQSDIKETQKTLEGYVVQSWTCANDQCLEEVLVKLNDFATDMLALQEEIDVELTDVSTNGPIVISNATNEYDQLYSRLGKYFYKFQICIDLILS